MLSSSSTTLSTTVWKGRPGVELKNEQLAAIVLTGGGHVVSMRALNLPEGVEDVNPLWEPPWPTTDPALRKLGCLSGMEPGELEGELLSGISGFNTCCDVFGAHSAGEVSSGLAFHGEAGLSTWEVTSVDVSGGAVTLEAHLRRTMLLMSRTFSLVDGTLRITERVRNLCGFERVMGRAYHITIGDAFLLAAGGAAPAPCSFRAACDKGMTWPTDDDPDGSGGSCWKPATEFVYPDVPLRAGGTESWCKYPRNERSSDLATLRVDPGGEYGWFVAERGGADSGKRLALAVAWERKAFPWLMTWEENRARNTAPWSGRTLCRGLEVSSYAFATSRRKNVEMGRLFDTPCFEWLDADETKSTTLFLSLQCVEGEPQTGLQLCSM